MCYFVYSCFFWFSFKAHFSARIRAFLVVFFFPFLMSTGAVFF
ncbi:hypothetical protein PORCRE_262 [Porphyromonas crevioricanis JCM 15906]|uniref:Uncharacterized protein n=1 Tax=Porphyromonas crevioricanis JCM 15906 TaxID=1305617 RepID=S4N6S1_9PORP|nr:hypothetical protein PORCRE_262 [Porphyromonas crevioricanis JCM 15906]